MVPPFAESISEGDIRWVKEVGDSVDQDETVAEVETDKVGVGGVRGGPCKLCIDRVFITLTLLTAVVQSIIIY